MAQEDKKPENKFLETYAEDMAEVIKDDPSGLVKKIIHEQEEKDALKNRMSPDSKRNKIYIILGVVFAVSAVLLVAFFLSRGGSNTVPVEPQFSPIIFNDKSFFIETKGMDREKIISSILSETRNSNLKAGGMEGIYLTAGREVMGLREFLTTLKTSFALPGAELASDNFMMGFANQNERNFFFLLKVRSFTDIFENLRSWEDKMFYDLHDFFGLPISYETSYLITKDFEDGIVENKNARILYDKNRVVVLMYVFADDASVVIADNPEAVREVMLRLGGSKLKK